MTAYIIGMIAGTVVTVFPLIYLMNFDRCLASILAAQPGFDTARFDPSYSLGLASSVTAVGAVILLLSAAMMAITGLRHLRPQKAKGQDAASLDSQLAPPAEGSSL